MQGEYTKIDFCIMANKSEVKVSITNDLTWYEALQIKHFIHEDITVDKERWP